MGYLIDSNWVIYILKNRGDYAAKVKLLSRSGLSISSVSLAEVLTGIVGRENEAKQRVLLDKFLGLVEEIPFDGEVAVVFAKVRSGLLKKHLPLENFDIAIAATAISQDLTLLTDDREHFARIEGLKIYEND